VRVCLRQSGPFAAEACSRTGQYFFQGFLGLSPIRNDAFPCCLCRDAKNTFLLLQCRKIEAGEFANAQARGIQKFQKRPVTAKEQAFSSPHGMSLLVRQIRGRGVWMQSVLLGNSPAGSRLPRSTELIQEAVHLFGRKHGWDTLRQLLRRNETRGILLQMTFADTILEE